MQQPQQYSVDLYTNEAGGYRRSSKTGTAREIFEWAKATPGEFAFCHTTGKPLIRPDLLAEMAGTSAAEEAKQILEENRVSIRRLFELPDSPPLEIRRKGQVLLSWTAAMGDRDMLEHEIANRLANLPELAWEDHFEQAAA